jgi:hypothetical protein
LITATQGIAHGSEPCTHKWLDDRKRLLHGEVRVFAAAIEPMVLSKPASDASAFDGKARVAQSAALHDQSPDWMTIAKRNSSRRPDSPMN